MVALVEGEVTRLGRWAPTDSLEFEVVRSRPKSPSKFLLPNLPQPWDRLPQCISEALGFVMCDARYRDQLCVHTGFLKFDNSRFRWVKRCDLIIARMNCQNRKPPPESG